MMTLILISILALLGLADAGYLYWKYIRHQVPQCIFGQECGFVLTSRWGRVFGIKNELLGLGYYLVVLAGCVGAIVRPEFSFLVRFLIIAVSVPAVLMSILLISIQTLRLKAYCSWCIASAVLNGAILALTLATIW